VFMECCADIAWSLFRLSLLLLNVAPRLSLSFASMRHSAFAVWDRAGVCTRCAWLPGHWSSLV